jgi:hypothetical protein
LTSLTLRVSLLYVSLFTYSIFLVYCTVRLRFPDDNILKKCINYITDHVKEYEAKETSLTLWALARMSYPSKHVQSLMLRKV